MSDDYKHEHNACCGGHDHQPAKGTRVLNADVKASSQTTLRVAGMDCPDEIAAIERALKPLTGVGEVKVNLMAGTATIVHDNPVTSELIIKAIGTAELKASLARYLRPTGFPEARTGCTSDSR